MYSCVLNPTYSDDEFARLFNDSWEKLPAHHKQFTQEESLTKQKSRIERMNYVLGVYEDDYLIFIEAGIENDNKVFIVSAYFGKNASGSKSYVYDPNWSSALNHFKSNETNFTEFNFTTINGSSIDNCFAGVINENDYSGVETGTAEQNGVTYNGTKYTY
tara:strand:+ start:1177 stop:1656 length:480 start_codon:yes stop_codon:yes gene_type:complete